MGAYQDTWIKNGCATRGDLAKRQVIQLDDWEQMKQRVAANGGYL